MSSRPSTPRVEPLPSALEAAKEAVVAGAVEQNSAAAGPSVAKAAPKAPPPKPNGGKKSIRDMSDDEAIGPPPVKAAKSEAGQAGAPMEE